MTTEKVPLKVEVNGEKIVIGEAVVEMQDGYIDITGLVTDKKWVTKLSGGISMSFTVDRESEKYAPREIDMQVAVKEGAHFKGVIPDGRIAPGSVLRSKRD